MWYVTCSMRRCRCVAGDVDMEPSVERTTREGVAQRALPSALAIPHIDWCAAWRSRTHASSACRLEWEVTAPCRKAAFLLARAGRPPENQQRLLRMPYIAKGGAALSSLIEGKLFPVKEGEHVHVDEMMIIVGFIVPGFLSGAPAWAGSSDSGSCLPFPAAAFSKGSRLGDGLPCYVHFTTSLCSARQHIRLRPCVDRKLDDPICIGGFCLRMWGADIEGLHRRAIHMNLITSPADPAGRRAGVLPVRGGVSLYGRGAEVALPPGAVRRWQRRGVRRRADRRGRTLCSPLRHDLRSASPPLIAIIGAGRGSIRCRSPFPALAPALLRTGPSAIRVRRW